MRILYWVDDPTDGVIRTPMQEHELTNRKYPSLLDNPWYQMRIISENSNNNIFRMWITTLMILNFNDVIL